MPQTPDLRPVGDLPNEIGKTAARELSFNGIASLKQVADYSKKELLAIHGVGPKAVAFSLNPWHAPYTCSANDRLVRGVVFRRGTTLA